MVEFDPKNVKAHPKVLEFYRQMKQVLAVPPALKHKGCCRRSRITGPWTRIHVRTLACDADFAPLRSRRRARSVRCTHVPHALFVIDSAFTPACLLLQKNQMALRATGERRNPLLDQGE